MQLKENFFTATLPKEDVKLKEEVEPINIHQEIADFPLVPYPERVYIIEEEVVRAGSLYVPKTARKDGEMQTNRGYVVAVGEGVEFCQPGDRVFYGRYSGAYVMDAKYRVMNEKDLLGRYK